MSCHLLDLKNLLSERCRLLILCTFLILCTVHVLNCDFIKVIDMSYFSAVKSLNRGLSFRKVFLF